jgi:glycosyltransferase involved in cell wall biosynthesis
MITVLHSIDTTGPGGAETVFVTLARAFNTGEFRSHAVICGPGWVSERLSQFGVTTHYVTAKNTSFNLRYLARLISLVRRHGIDVIHSHLFGSNVYCSLAGLITGTPVISTYHGRVDVDSDAKLASLKGWIVAIGSRAIVVVSEDLLTKLRTAISLPSEKVRVIANGIDLSRFQGAVRRSGDGSFTIGALGNIRPAKGYEVLLRAVAILVERYGPRIQTLVAGQRDRGQLLESLLRLRSELGIESNIEFVGHVADVVPFLQNLDVFVMSSWDEGLPVALLEAMASGVPVVATMAGGTRELITNGETGLLVPIGSSESLAQNVAQLLDSPGLRRDLADRARTLVAQRFSEQRMLKRYQELYQAAVKKS